MRRSRFFIGHVPPEHALKLIPRLAQRKPNTKRPKFENRESKITADLALDC